MKENKKCKMILDHNPVWGGDGYFCIKCGLEFISKSQPINCQDWEMAFEKRKFLIGIDAIYGSLNQVNRNMIIGEYELIKDFISNLLLQKRKEVIEEMENLIVEEINIARTSKAGKTSRLTALYLKVKKLK